MNTTTESLTDHKQAATAFLHYRGRFWNMGGDCNKALRRRMIEWLTGKAKAPMYECSVSRVRDALVAASGVDVIACGIEPNVERAVQAWAEEVTK